jgi:hypothetical protein
MVGGAGMDGSECVSAEELWFAGLFALGLAGLLARGICFCLPGVLCLRKVFSLAFSGLACRAYAGGVLEGRVGRAARLGHVLGLSGFMYGR